MIIKAQKGRGKKIHILINDEYKLTVTQDFWFGQSILSGDEISDEEFAAFCKAANSNRALSSAVNILSHRDHSAMELERKVARTNDSEYAHEAIERLKELGYIDDERYARNLAQELYERRHMSPRRIEQELCQRGVDRETAAICAQEFEGNNVERITELLCTKFKGKFLDEKGKRRTYNALVRLGYSSHDIFSAMREISDYYDDFEEYVDY